MKHLLIFLFGTLLLASCTPIQYTSSGAESDDIYYDPGNVQYVEQPATAEEVQTDPNSDYWSEDMAQTAPLTENGDVYIDNYNSGYAYNDPYMNSRLDWYFPYRTSFSLYYGNSSMFYDPWYGWQVGFGWGYRPIRPWACYSWSPYWGYGWGNSWYCNPYSYGFNPYWNYPYAAYSPYYNGGYIGGYLYGDNNRGSNGYYYGHRNPISSGSAVTSAYSRDNIYQVGRHYEDLKPLSSTRPETRPVDMSTSRVPQTSGTALERPMISRPETSPVRRPSADPTQRPTDINRGVQPDLRPTRTPDSSPSTRPNSPSTRPTPPATRPQNRPSTRPSSRPSTRPSTRPSNPPSSPNRGGGGGTTPSRRGGRGSFGMDMGSGNSGFSFGTPSRSGSRSQSPSFGSPSRGSMGGSSSPSRSSRSSSTRSRR